MAWVAGLGDALQQRGVLALVPLAHAVQAELLHANDLAALLRAVYSGVFEVGFAVSVDEIGSPKKSSGHY